MQSLRNLCIWTPSDLSPGDPSVLPLTIFRGPRRLGPDPCTLTCGRPVPGGGAPGPCSGGGGSDGRSGAALGRRGVAPPAARPTAVGERGERARAFGPGLISIPSAHARPVGASGRMRSLGSRGLAGETGGWVREAGKLVSRRGTSGPRTVGECTAAREAYGG